MAEDNRNEVGEWLDSGGGQWTVTIAAVLLAVGFLVYMVMSLTGWMQWAAIAAIVVLVGAAGWWFFLRRSED